MSFHSYFACGGSSRYLIMLLFKCTRLCSDHFSSSGCCQADANVAKLPTPARIANRSLALLCDTMVRYIFYSHVEFPIPVSQTGFNCCKFCTIQSQRTLTQKTLAVYPTSIEKEENIPCADLIARRLFRYPKGNFFFRFYLGQTD